MDIEQVKQAKTQEEARQFAIDWQHWQADQNMSYGEMSEWNHVFEVLAKKFDLTEEFTENGII